MNNLNKIIKLADKFERILRKNAKADYYFSPRNKEFQKTIYPTLEKFKKVIETAVLNAKKNGPLTDLTSYEVRGYVVLPVTVNEADISKLKFDFEWEYFVADPQSSLKDLQTIINSLVPTIESRLRSVVQSKLNIILSLSDSTESIPDQGGRPGTPSEKEESCTSNLWRFRQTGLVRINP